MALYMFATIMYMGVHGRWRLPQGLPARFVSHGRPMVTACLDILRGSMLNPSNITPRQNGAHWASVAEQVPQVVAALRRSDARSGVLSLFQTALWWLQRSRNTRRGDLFVDAPTNGGDTAAIASHRTSLAGTTQSSMNPRAAVPHASPPATTLSPVVVQSGRRAGLASQCLATQIAGHTVYPVRSNATPSLLLALWEHGVRHFSVVSMQEMRLVRELLPSEAVLFYRSFAAVAGAVREAYYRYNVRVFAVDTMSQLDIIRHETRREGDHVTDLMLCICLGVTGSPTQKPAVPVWDAGVTDVVSLIAAAHRHASHLGISLEVPGHTVDCARVMERSLKVAHTALEMAAVSADFVHMHGQLGSDHTDPVVSVALPWWPMIDRQLYRLARLGVAERWIEPERCVSASYSTLILHVLDRRQRRLVVDDPPGGALWNAASRGRRLQGQLNQPPPATVPCTDFTLYSSLHRYLGGPVRLPTTMKKGDSIQIFNMGASVPAMTADSFPYQQIVTLEDGMSNEGEWHTSGTD